MFLADKGKKILSSCGVFALAYITELLHSDFKLELTHLRFHTKLMRKHLIQCIDSEIFTIFPNFFSPKLPPLIPKVESIRLYCDCNMPKFVDNLIRCDNWGCPKKWFHYSCVGYRAGDKSSFICKHCKW